MDVAILGASGDCGRQIAAQLVASKLLAPTERLQLVGRANGSSARSLYGLASDLTDSYAEHVPDMDVALHPHEVVADLWVVAAGQTAPTDSGTVDRQSLARGNARVFAEYADALARYGQGTEIVIVVSNPVELGVALFAQAVGRQRVIGIGAYQDTLRFRREIAADLGVRRQRVGGFMLGEHGDAQVPIWSSVTIQGLQEHETPRAIQAIRRGFSDESFPDLCRREREKLVGLVHAGELAEAFRRTDLLPADVRVVIKPFLTHLSGAKTALATANVTVDLLQTLLDGREMLVAGQVSLEDGEFYGLTGILGVPAIVSPGGIRRVYELPLNTTEERAIREISAHINGKVGQWMDGLK